MTRKMLNKNRDCYIILTMLLAAFYILRPVTGMWFFIVKQTTDAQLFGCCAIPTCPVPRARCFVAENSVKPITVVGSKWGICNTKMCSTYETLPHFTLFLTIQPLLTCWLRSFEHASNEEGIWATKIKHFSNRSKNEF